MAFQKFSSFSELKEAGIEYVISVGRRQPMHIGHQQSIDDIFANGLKPIIIAGSTNKGHKINGQLDPFFEPVANPLTYEQQIEQIKRTWPDKVLGKDYFVSSIGDIGDNEEWCESLSKIVAGQLEIDGRYPDLSEKTAFLFTGKVEDKRPRRLKTGEGEEKEVLAYFWEGIFDKLGLSVLEMPPHQNISISLSARNLRNLDLNNLTPEQESQFAAIQYIRELANNARAANGLKADIPVTTFDLSVDRLTKEKSIGIGSIELSAKSHATQPQLNDYIEAAKELNKSIVKEKTKRLKIASASPNQTAYDFANNVANITAAIDKAVADGADLLSLPELCLTGYSADDYHQWNKNNETVWRQLKYIAEYAASKDPNLIISVGAPWHYADKELRASEALYNINNRPYNVQATITGGKVVAMAAKSILADGPAEYEPRQFRVWPSEKGTIKIPLPDGSIIPFGKPIIKFGKDGEWFIVFHEQCAEGWPGVNDDLTIVTREQNQARLIAELSKTNDLSVVINPSASRPQPAINKEEIRANLCTSGSNFCGVFVYTNYLGSESGIYAAEGSRLWAQDGKIIHHGERYSFANVSYSSTTVDIPLAKKGNPHLTIERAFKEHEVATVGKEADFEAVKSDGDKLIYEEYARSISLWLRDYLAKQSWPAQGYLISLSGGADSAYGAIAIAQMIELDVKQEGITGFFERFSNLKCKDEALKINQEQGEEAAIKFIKKKMLACVYLPTENSSETTLNAARTLVEGGVLPDGTKVEGIGGSFSVHNVQRSLDEYLISHAGLDIDKAVSDAESDKSRGWLALGFSKAVKFISNNLEVANGLYEGWMQLVIKREIKKFVNAERDSNPQLPKYIADNCKRKIPTWSELSDDITLQNYQARTRLVIPWAIANQEGKIALVTSNASEAAISYTTAGGDMHMGGANPIGGLPKSTLKKSLQYFRECGLVGLKAIPALHYITVQKPTAELRKAIEGQAQQTDEGDLGFTYEQSEGMERAALTGRRTPIEAFDYLKGKNDFPSDPVELRRILVRFLGYRWPSGQFKRVMATLAPYLGDNFDPHASIRTTVLGDHFKTGLALLTLHILAEKHGGQNKFAEAIGVPFDGIKGIVERSRGFKDLLTKVDCALLEANLDDLSNGFFAKELRLKYRDVQQLTQRVA